MRWSGIPWSGIPEVKEGARLSGVHEKICFFCEYIGLTFWKLGYDETALKHFEKAESSFVEDHSNPDQFRIFKTIGDFYLTKGEHVLTIKYENHIQHFEAYIARQKEIPPGLVDFILNRRFSPAATEMKPIRASFHDTC